MRSQARASSPHPPTPTPRRRRPLTPQLIWKDTSCVGVLPDELLRSPGVPCSSGRAVVGTTPGMMCVRTAPASRAHTHHALRRADTFLVRQSRLAPRSYHRPLAERAPIKRGNMPMHTSRAMLSHSLAYVHGHVSPRRARVCRRLRGCRGAV